MSDKEETQLKETEVFHGATGSGGLSWAEFDELVRDWGLKRYGFEISTWFWEDTYPDFTDLNILNPIQRETWEFHCTKVYDNMSETQFKWSESLFKSARFWTADFQDSWKQRQYEKYYVYLKKVCRGEAK